MSRPRARAGGLAAIAGCALLSALLGFGCGAEGETVAVERTPEERGEALLGDTSLGRAGNLVACNDCHAAGGEGAPRLSGAPLDRAVDRPSFWGGQENDLLRSVNQCLYWFMGRSTPLAAGDPQGDDLYAYLSSLPGDDALAAAQPFTLGLLQWPGAGDATRGETVYADACASCHGDKTTGDGALVPSAPKLPDDTLVAHADEKGYTAEQRRIVFVEKVRHGPFIGYGGTMPPFSVEVVSDADLADLLTYMGVP